MHFETFRAKIIDRHPNILELRKKKGFFREVTDRAVLWGLFSLNFIPLYTASVGSQNIATTGYWLTMVILVILAFGGGMEEEKYKKLLKSTKKKDIMTFDELFVKRTSPPAYKVISNLIISGTFVAWGYQGFVFSTVAGLFCWSIWLACNENIKKLKAERMDQIARGVNVSYIDDYKGLLDG